MNLMVMSTLLEKPIRAFMTICLVSGREVGRLINTGAPAPGSTDRAVEYNLHGFFLCCHAGEISRNMSNTLPTRPDMHAAQMRVSNAFVFARRRDDICSRGPRWSVKQVVKNI